MSAAVSSVLAPERPGFVAASPAHRQVELRRAAEMLLEDVARGAAPAPVTPDLARAMAQVAFSTSSHSGYGRSLDSSLGTFLALLSHPDISEDVLRWVAQDRVFTQPSAFAALLAHPACTTPVLFSTVRLFLWHTHGAVDATDWTFSHPLISVLRASGFRGRATALLLALWADEDYQHFCEVLELLLTGSDGTLEILSTLADDLRLSRQARTYRLAGADLHRLVEHVLLIPLD